MAASQFSLQQINPYAGLDAAERLDRAAEMAREILADIDRSDVVVTAIVERLLPGEDEEDSPEPGALALAEILHERLADRDQLLRLIECLEARS
jgi:hypothetical protein